MRAVTEVQTVQTQTTVIVPPTPARVFIFGSIEKVKEGVKMIRYQFNQPYASRVLTAPAIKVAKEFGSLPFNQVAIVGVFKEKREWWREPRGGKEGIKAEVKGVTERIVIKIWKPREQPRRVGHVLVIGTWPLRSTAMGGRDDVDLYVDGEVYKWTGANISRSGNHGTYMAVILALSVRIHRIHVSNRGNRYEYVELYTPDGYNEKPRYEEIRTVKAWSYGRHVIMRDNLTNETFDALVLEFHEARKTCAATRHYIDPEDVLEPLFDTTHSMKTHWTEVYKLVKPAKVKTIRVSNNCREYVEEVTVEPTHSK